MAPSEVALPHPLLCFTCLCHCTFGSPYAARVRALEEKLPETERHIKRYLPPGSELPSKAVGQVGEGIPGWVWVETAFHWVPSGEGLERWQVASRTPMLAFSNTCRMAAFATAKVTTELERACADRSFAGHAAAPGAGA